MSLAYALHLTMTRKKVPLNELHLAMQKLFVMELQLLVLDPQGLFYNSPQHRKLSDELDALLNTCPTGEFCEQCADIFCPYGEQLHFHHDGCPCCDGGPIIPDREERQEERLERWKVLLQRNTRA